VPTLRGREPEAAGWQPDPTRFLGILFGIGIGALAGGIAAEQYGAHAIVLVVGLAFSAVAGAFVGARWITAVLRALGRLIHRTMRFWVKPRPDFPSERARCLGGLVGSIAGIVGGALWGGFYSAIHGVMWGEFAGEGVVIWTWKAGRASARFALPLIIVGVSAGMIAFSVRVLYRPHNVIVPRVVLVGMAWLIVAVVGVRLAVFAYQQCSHRGTTGVSSE
jgi:hypothetical protein